ncbi:hypothetical protein PCI56_02615 [Plesiomonas shigelloides subsp. oncorhynchi]|nr:hypothetical protein [Plesiomonas shigelloides]
MIKQRLQKLLKKSPTESAQTRIGEPVLEDYARAEDFNERRFWHKLKGVAKKAGYSVLEKCLWLYYTAQKPDTRNGRKLQFMLRWPILCYRWMRFRILFLVLVIAMTSAFWPRRYCPYRCIWMRA